jgi:uncharacterized membrane-anchored protein YhcB (DUF1043 family)
MHESAKTIVIYILAALIAGTVIGIIHMFLA